MAPFTGYDLGELVAAATLAGRLDWLCSAVNGHRSDTEAAEHTVVRLRMFLDGRP